jgi:prefoldin alpha subunit
MATKNYDLFISSLKQKINIDENSIQTLKKKIKSMTQLIDYLNTLIHLNKTSHEIEIDIGNGIYVKSKKDSSSKSIIINIGVNIYIDLPYENAKEIIFKQKDIIEKKIYLIEKEIIKNKSYIKLTQILSQSLKKHQLLEGNYDEKKEIDEINNTISSINI